MASELQIHAATGATIKCDVRPINGGASLGTVTLTESSGYYYGDFPSASAGWHILLYYDDTSGDSLAAVPVYWTGSAIDPASQPINANVASISGDSGAADALEAMLDGTRAVLYLSQLNIADPPADEAPVKIIGTRSDAGALPAVYIAGGTANGSEPQNGVEIIGGSYGAGVAQGHAVVLTGGEAPADGGTPGRGLLAIGGAGGASVDGGPGIEARGGAANSGLGGTGMLCKGGSTAGAVAGIGLLCEGAVGSNSQTAGIGARFIGGAGVGDTGIGGVGFSVKGGASGASIAGPSAVTATGGAGNVTGSAVFPVDAEAIADEVETRTLEIDLDGASIDGLANAMRVILAAIAGKVSGMDTNSPAFRDYADTKNRISATTDADGNRSAVTLDAT